MKTCAHFHLLNKWFSSIQSLSHVGLFATSLSITNSRSLPKLMSIELVMLSNHLILCCPLLLLPSIFPNIRIFSEESVLHIRSSKDWSFSFSISPSNEYSGLISLDYYYYSNESFPDPFKKIKRTIIHGTLFNKLYKHIVLFAKSCPIISFIPIRASRVGGKHMVKELS